MLVLIFTALFTVVISYWLVNLILRCFSKERQLEIMEMLALHQGLVGLVIITLGLLSFFYFDIKPMQLIPVLILIIGYLDPSVLVDVGKDQLCLPFLK